MNLVLVAHGTRDPAGSSTTYELADRVRDRLAGTDVRVAFADVREPSLTAVLRDTDEPAVVVPAFLASGYHVRVDIPAQAARSGRRPVITPPLGPAPEMVAAAHDRLAAAGWRPGDTVVLAAAGSADPLAHIDVRRAAAWLADRLDTAVRIGYVATASPRLTDVVRTAAGRVAVASWLLAPGMFHRRARRSGAAVIAAPLGAHPAVADLVVERYRSAASQLEPCLVDIASRRSTEPQGYRDGTQPQSTRTPAPIAGTQPTL